MLPGCVSTIEYSDGGLPIIYTYRMPVSITSISLASYKEGAQEALQAAMCAATRTEDMAPYQAPILLSLLSLSLRQAVKTGDPRPSPLPGCLEPRPNEVDNNPS